MPGTGSSGSSGSYGVFGGVCGFSVNFPESCVCSLIYIPIANVEALIVLKQCRQNNSMRLKAIRVLQARFVRNRSFL